MDALTNWDGIDDYKGVRYNAVLDVDLAEGVVTEPVTLEEAKTHLRITFTDDDAKISALITQCRAALEKHKGISLVPKTVTAVLHNALGSIELPYGPVGNVTEVADRQGNVIAGAITTGIVFKNLLYPVSHEPITVTYEAGYATVPYQIKLELLDMVAHVYANPGQTAQALTLFSKSGSRKTWLI